MIETGDLIGAFRQMVSNNGERVAISNGSEQVTYSGLESASNDIATSLLSYKTNAGKPHATVGLYFRQTVDIIPAILGALKSGSPYVPLETYLPEKRLQKIVDDAAVDIIITNNQLLEGARQMVGERDIVILSLGDVEKSGRAPEVSVNPQDVAYIMYTSGSTGQPKGVMQTYENIHFFASQFASLLRVSSQDRLALTTSFGHTVSAIDIFSHLLSGAQIMIYDVKNENNIVQLGNWFERDHITVFHSIPSLFRIVFGQASGGLQAVRLVILGGEDVRVKDFDLYKNVCSDRTVFVNLYGSSELIIGFAQLMNKKSDITRNRIPIGRPFKGLKCEVVGENGEKKGVLGKGQLVFQTQYLSPGYKNISVDSLRPADEPGVRIYESGDMARMLPDGTVEYLGREDNMLKVNGNRIEINEIEINTDAFPGVNKSVVKIFERSEGQQFLACFYTSDVEDIDEKEIRNFLLSSLPGYMIPELFVPLEQFPKTATGKVDRNALSINDLLTRQHIDRTEPTSETEAKVCNIWKDILGHDAFGVLDKFFDVGGNSLRLIELHGKLGDVFKERSPSVQLVFDHQTVSQIASLIDKGESDMKEEETSEELVKDFEF